MSTLHAARITVAAGLLAAAPLAWAVDPILAPGNVELDFGGSIDRSTLEVEGFGEESSTTISLSFQGGYFVSSLFEVGGAASILDTDVAGDSFSYVQAGPFINLNFVSPGSRVVPVIGVSPQLVFGDLSGSAFELSGGLRVFASDDVSVNWRVFYEMAEVEDDDFPVDQELTTFGTRLGFSWILR